MEKAVTFYRDSKRRAREMLSGQYLPSHQVFYPFTHFVRAITPHRR